MGVLVNSRRAANLVVKLVEGVERWEALDPPLECSPSKVGWNRAKSHSHLHEAEESWAQAHDWRCNRQIVGLSLDATKDSSCRGADVRDVYHKAQSPYIVVV
ncbi:hypothetical protein TNCV_4496241 [Trichonephila clavipes]|nr:hypothetical protein TNCV_4496241 [Trichonephila clavipes]